MTVRIGWRRALVGAVAAAALVVGGSIVAGLPAEAVPPGVAESAVWGTDLLAGVHVEAAPSGVRFVDVSNGSGHSLALDDQGRVWSRGYNRTGQLGTGVVAPSDVLPTTVWSPVTILPPDVTFSAVEASNQPGSGEGFSLALATDGTVWSWGKNEYGQLGNGEGGYYPVVPVTPEHVELLNRVVQISAGDYHVLALDSTGHAWGWGSNGSGQLGAASLTQTTIGQLPQPITGVDHLVAVSAGGQFSEVLDDQGRLWGFGTACCGVSPLGAERTTGFNWDPLPPNVPAGVTFSQVTAGETFTAALATDGTVWTWGSSLLGELGRGAAPTAGPAPILTAAGGAAVPGFLDIDAASRSVVALDVNGELWAWGRNEVHILGDEESVAISDRPLQVGTGDLPAGSKFALVDAGDRFGNALPAFFRSASPPEGQVGITYGPYSFVAVGLGDVTYTTTPDDLPPGTTLTSDGVLSGEPTLAGTYDIVVTATDQAGASVATDVISITIDPPPPPPPVAPSFGQVTPPGGVVGVAYVGYTFTATGDPVIAFDTAVPLPDLPAGMSLSAGGVLSGTPQVAGVYTFTLRATNGAGSVTTPVSITIDPPPPPPPQADLSVSVTQLTSAVLGDAASTTFIVRNLGPDPASDVVLDVTLDRYVVRTSLPVGCSFLGADSAGNALVRCFSSGIPNGGSLVYPFVGRAAPTTGSCTIFGTSGDDNITGTAASDVICGLGGADTITGRGGADTLVGDIPEYQTPYTATNAATVRSSTIDLNSANDSATAATAVSLGTPSGDVLFGGDGTDTISGQAGRDQLFGGAEADRILGGAGGDTVAGGTGDDRVQGQDGNDSLDGEGGIDVMSGGTGNDIIRGGGSDDWLGGGDGNDELYGEGGNDVLHGGSNIPPGLNLLDGGPGSDCASNGPDTRTSIETRGVCRPAPA